MKTNKQTFREMLDNFKPQPMSVGEACHIISRMTTERVDKGKKDKLYQVKHKKRIGNDSLYNSGIYKLTLI